LKTWSLVRPKTPSFKGTRIWTTNKEDTMNVGVRILVSIGISVVATICSTYLLRRLDERRRA
jgi:hypothetical protein